jgi:UDPglucose 6-dehydrogenase
MREAPSREIIKELVKRGARVQAYDPVANIEAEKAFDVDLLASERAQIVCVESMKLAIKSADALIIITEWKSFRSPDFYDLKKELKMPVIFDGRNLYEPSEMKEIGFTYYGVGRSTNQVY